MDELPKKSQTPTLDYRGAKNVVPPRTASIVVVYVLGAMGILCVLAGLIAVLLATGFFKIDTGYLAAAIGLLTAGGFLIWLGEYWSGENRE